MTFEQEKRAYELYLHASELVEPELSAWLDSLSIEGEVRDELRGLLAVDSEQGSMPPNGITGALRLLGGSVASGEELVGTTLGPYLVEELVRDISGKHKGGMGFVYKAHRNDGAGDRVVAIKVLPRASERERELFLRERRNLFKLTHPNIVQIIDAGSLTDGRPYYVMEWVEGGADLTEYCKMRGLSVRERLKLFLRVCSAVGRAHRSGVIHKDLKPSNIQVDRGGVPKLLDFGLSSHLDDETTEKLSRSILTPAYASPEQMRGEVLTLSSDVYSLGLVLRETLGMPAIEDEVSSASLSTTSKLADMELRSIVSKMLSKSPAERYQTVDAVEKELEAWLSGNVVEAYRSTTKSGPVYVAQKFVRRNLLGVSLSGLAVLVLAYGFISITKERNEALRQRTNAVSGQLAAMAQVQIDAGDIATGGVLAIESLRRRESFEGNQAARRVLRYLPDRIWSTKLPHPPNRLSFSSDGKYIGAFYDQEGKVEVRRSSSGELVLAAAHGLREGCDPPGRCGETTLAFDPNHPECATSGEDGVVRIWDLQSTTLVRELPANEPGLRQIEYWTNDVLAASIDEDRVGLFDSKTGKLLYSADTGGELPTLSSDGKVFVLSRPISEDMQYATVHDPSSYAPLASIASATDDPIVRIRTNPKRPEVAALVGRLGDALALAFTDLGAQKQLKLVLGPSTGVATASRSIDMANLGPKFWGRRALNASRRLRFSADGQHLIVYDSKLLYLVDAVEKKILKVWPRDTFTEGDAEGSAYLTPANSLGTRLHNLPDFQLESVIQMPLESSALAPSGRSFVTAKSSGELELWTPHHFADELNDGKVIHAAFSPDSRYMASINTSGTFAIRSTQSDTIVYRERLEPPSDNSTSGVAFNPVSRYVTLRLNAHTYLYETRSWKRLAQSPDLGGGGSRREHDFTPSEFLGDGRWLQQRLPRRMIVFSVPDLKLVYQAEEHAFVAAITSTLAVIYRARQESKSSEVEVVSLPGWTVVRRFEIPRRVEGCTIGERSIACSITDDDREEEGQVRSVGGIGILSGSRTSRKIQVWTINGSRSETVEIPQAVAVLKIELSNERMTVICRNAQTENIVQVEFGMWPLHLIRRRSAPEMERSFPVRLTADLTRTTDILSFAARLLRSRAGVPVETKLLDPVADGSEMRLYVSDDERFAALALSDGFFRLEPLRGADLAERLCRKLEFNLDKSGWSHFMPDEPYRATCPGLPQRPSE